jgi:hypothetical protein
MRLSANVLAGCDACVAGSVGETRAAWLSARTSHWGEPGNRLELPEGFGFVMDDGHAVRLLLASRAPVPRSCSRVTTRPCAESMGPRLRRCHEASA